MNQQNLIKETAKYFVADLQAKLFEVIDNLPYDECNFDERHLLIAMRIILNDVDAPVEQIIKKIKIADYTGNKFLPDKSNE